MGPTSQMRVGSWIVVVIRCFGVVSLSGVWTPRGVDLGGVSLPEVLTSQHFLLTLNVASLLCLSLLQPE
jgi:hypothetical protein